MIWEHKTEVLSLNKQRWQDSENAWQSLRRILVVCSNNCKTLKMFGTCMLNLVGQTNKAEKFIRKRHGRKTSMLVANSSSSGSRTSMYFKKVAVLGPQMRVWDQMDN